MKKGIKQSGGARPGAGRPKGSLGLRCREQVEEIARLYPDWSPLHHFAKVANDEELPAEVRLDAAKCAAPYLHAKLKMVELDPEAELEFQEALAEIRSRHTASALKEGLGTYGLADRLQRMIDAKRDERDSIDSAFLAGRSSVEPTSAPVLPAPVPAVEAPADATAPSAGSYAPVSHPEPMPAADAAIIGTVATHYSPILPWPDTPTQPTQEYDVLGSWGLD